MLRLWRNCSGMLGKPAMSLTQHYQFTAKGRAVWLCSAVMLLASLLLGRPGLTHPLGNFTISHYTAIKVTREAIELHYLLDLAEIPAFQELQETNLVPDVGHPSGQAYLARQSVVLQAGLHLTVNGQPLALQVVSHELLFPPGAGGLPTLKLGVVYRALYQSGSPETVYHLHYSDRNFPGRAGWQEIIATAEPGIILLQSSVPRTDRSQALTNYPTDLLNSPPQILEATIHFQLQRQDIALGGGPTVAPVVPADALASLSVDSRPSSPSGRATAPGLVANRQPTPRNAFTDLVTTPHLSATTLVLALAVAAVLGAGHALEPGHGKTVVAAYLVGTRGTARHALSLGLVVTATHTAGVYLLGLLTLYASRYIVPERLYPWLGVGAGLGIAGLGLYLLLQRWTGSQAHIHGQSPPLDHPHSHVLHSHSHSHASHSHSQAQGHDPQHASGQHTHHGASAGPQQHHPGPLPRETVTFRELLMLGITGGIVPCPAALVVLLSAVAMGRIGFGLLLILAFSVGLAAVLIAIGLLMVYARQFMSRFQGEGALVSRWLPLLSAAVVTVFGVLMTLQALDAAGVLSVGF